MAQVFLSYDHEDSIHAAPIAAALVNAGHCVWWDEQIKVGAQYNREIDAALKQADAVVVLWSERSVDSAWVRDEAAAGRDSGRLIPVSLDSSDPPLGFRQYQTIDLSTPRGRRRSARLRQLVGAVEALREPITRETPEAATGDHPRIRREWPLMGALVALIALAAAVTGLFLWRPWASAALPVVVVRPADQTPYAKALARDLLVGLGDVQSTDSHSLQLVDENSHAQPDLIFEVSGTASGPRPSGNLLLLRGKDRQVLSSQDLEAGSSSVTDLKASMAMSAARMLGCAMEALEAPRPPLRSADLKLYLGACERFATVYGSPDPAYVLASQLEQLVAKAPAFAPAWKRLLLLEASLQTLPNDHDKPSPDGLKRHIVGARRIDAHMAEANVAEAELLPTTDFAARLALIERAVSRAPNDPGVLDARAVHLIRIGRLNDAVSDAEQAARIDPSSPSTRNVYVLALAYSGRLPRAINELDEAQRLSPSAHNLIETRFSLSMRYGDPRVARQILRSHGTGVAPEAFLQARIDPTSVNIEHAVAVARATAARFGILLGGQVETLAAFGRDDEIYELLLRLPEPKFEANLAASLFRPTLKSFRQQPRFLGVAQRLGLLDYWRSSGKWPDFCFEPDLPYDCKVEAAKLAA
jgi:tetratricopeptide (TPR) repeat protein